MSKTQAPARKITPHGGTESKEIAEGFEQIRRTCDLWLDRLSDGPTHGASSVVDAAADADDGQVDQARFEAMWHPKTSQQVRDMGAAIFRRLVTQIGAAESRKAAEIAFAVVNDIRQLFGGSALYLSRGHFEAASDHKKAAVVAMYNGTNLKEVAREFGITDTRVRQILEEVRRARRGKAQGNKDALPAAPQLPAKPTKSADAPAPMHPWRK